MSAPELVAEACRWLRFAREDISAAERLLTGGSFVPRHVCLLAQQSAEKALKAALVLDGIEFPSQHDLDALRNLPGEGWAVEREYLIWRNSPSGR